MTAATGPRLQLTRDQILAHRRRVGALDERLPAVGDSLNQAAWAGLQDSMPRAALLSIHARVAGTRPDTLDDPALIQVWGPRFSAYVVAARDRAIFTLGRLPDGRRAREFQAIADDLETFLAGRRMSASEAGHAMGVDPNRLRYAAPTGRVVIRWDGAHQPTLWTVPAPGMEPGEARLELARRYLHVFGPATANGFETWAGIRSPRGHAAFETLGPTLVPVETPIGEAWILASDEDGFRAAPMASAPARLLPSGDAYFLLQGRDRQMLVPDPRRRGELWTPRVWPGAVLASGEVAGTWRRAGPIVAIQAWRRFAPEEREAIEAEAVALPLPGLEGQVRTRWDD